MGRPLVADRPDMTAIAEYEKLNPVTLFEHQGVRIIYCTPTLTTKWRADGAYYNEPRTLDWIAGFAAEDVLFDVGANVGMYTMVIVRSGRGIRAGVSIRPGGF